MSNNLNLNGCSVIPTEEIHSYTPNLKNLAENRDRMYTKEFIASGVPENRYRVYTQNSLDRYLTRVLKADPDFKITGPESLELGWVRADSSYSISAPIKFPVLNISGASNSSGMDCKLNFDSVDDRDKYVNHLLSNKNSLSGRPSLEFSNSGMKSKLMYNKLKLDNLDVLPVSVKLNSRDETSISKLGSMKEVPNMTEVKNNMTFLRAVGRVIDILDLSSTTEKAKSDYTVATHLNSFRKGTIECHDETIYITMFRKSESTMDTLSDRLQITFSSGKDSFDYMNCLTESNVKKVCFIQDFIKVIRP